MFTIETDTKSWRQTAANITLYAHLHDSPWGTCLVATINDALATLIFWGSTDKSEAATTRYLKEHWGHTVTIIYSKEKTKHSAQVALKSVKEGSAPTLNLLLKGTAFQRSVWKELLEIPQGSSRQYQDIANSIKSPKAVRAVGTAVGKNPISLYVPCHRVFPAAGGVGGYAWGPKLKEALLQEEGISFKSSTRTGTSPS